MYKTLLLFFLTINFSRATVLEKNLFLEWVKANDFQTTEEVISNIPVQEFQNLTIAIKSGALLPATKDAPRPLIWNEEKPFILTYRAFTPNDQHPDSIEAVSWNESTSTWELLELDVKRKKWLVNQPKCLECHGNTARPIWGEYPHWPGFLGKNRGILNSKEKEILGAFQDRPDIRNRQLQQIIKPSEFPFPFRLKSDWDTPRASKIHMRPNMRLGQLMARYNAKSIYKKLVDHLTTNELEALFLSIEYNSLKPEIQKLESYFSKAGLELADLDLAQDHSKEIKTDWVNIYFDGDAEVFEYLLWHYKRDNQSSNLHESEISLERKYPLHFPANEDVASILLNFDRISKWIELPFPNDIRNRRRTRHVFRPVE